jgi:hypothetical protein
MNKENTKLPEKILEISLLPEDGIFYIRFKETLEKEIGEPVHPLIHIFKDEKGYISALEIINLNKIMQAKNNTLKYKNLYSKNMENINEKSNG